MRSTRNSARQKTDRGGLPVERFAHKFWSKCRKWTRSSAPAKSNALWKRWKGSSRASGAAVRVSLSRPDAAYLTTPKHAAYIKIAEAATIPARFASFRSFAARFAAGDSNRWCARRESSKGRGAEITLIGQDTTSYGEDLGLRDGLAQLLEKLAQTDGLLWVRFLYAYPNRVTQKLLDTIAAHPRIAKYMTCRCSTPAATCWRG